MNTKLKEKKDVIRLKLLSAADIDSMITVGNNKKIWDNLTDGFPHPFTKEAAIAFLERVAKSDPVTVHGIEWNGIHVGNIGLHPQSDIYSKTAELGYFVGEDYWGRGIATEAIRLACDYGFNVLDLNRIEAGVFEYNLPSMHILEKNGFKKEGIALKRGVKNEKVMDIHQYALINPKYL